jgi:hypothetical protein
MATETTGMIRAKGKREALLKNGYCCFEGILSEAQVNALRAVTEQLADAMTAEQTAAERTTGSMMPVTRDPAYAELIAHPDALESLRALGWDRPTYTDGWLISKPGGSPRLFWHYDWFAWEDEFSFRAEPPQVFLMYYLNDTRRENGCLRVIPGSHVRHNLLHDLLPPPHSQDVKREADPSRPEFSDRSDEVDVPVRAGDLLIGDARLLHAAHANTTVERRSLVTLWFQPDFDAMPERLQAQMVAKTQRPPNDWPDAARRRVTPLLPHYDGTAEPYGRSLYRRLI